MPLTLTSLEDQRSGIELVAVTQSKTIRAAEPRVAGNLLCAARAHALPDPPYMRVVIADDGPLRELLVSAGATVRLDFVHHEEG